MTRVGAILLAIGAMLLPLGGRAQVVINEIMAANSSIAPLTGLTNYFPDYVELRNTTASDIDLHAGQWTLSTKTSPRPNDFKDFFNFPSNTFIRANSYLLVFFDDKTNNPGVHTTYTVGGTNVTFSLKGTGDRVQLYNNRSSLVDSNIFGFQVSDYPIGRVPDSTGAFTLTRPTPARANIPAPFVPAPASSNQVALKINEWLAFSTNDVTTNADWFEVFNPDTNIVSLTGLVFVDRGYNQADLDKPENRIPPLSFIGSQGFVQIFADNLGLDEDTVDFALSSTGGDDIYMFGTNRMTLIDTVNLPIFPEANVSRGRVPDGSPRIIELPSLSPGARNFGAIPEILINEVLTHTDLPLEDAIELYNPTSTNVNIGDWWLTNDPNVPKKFRIPANTIVSNGGYIVFYEGRKYQDLRPPPGFNRTGNDISPYFSFNSARGDEAYLYKGNPDGTLTGDRRGIDFGPSENGVSFGRYITSEGKADIVAMSERTFGSDFPFTLQQLRFGTGKSNSYPKISRVVITEIHYHPKDLASGQDNDIDEFIELRNISGQSVLLYDPNFPTNTWRLKDAVDFTFPAKQSLDPDEYALVVRFNPTNDSPQLLAFRTAFPGIPNDTKFYGPYKGKLADSGATVELAWPDHPQSINRVDAGLVPYIVADRVNYNDKLPWPEDADGDGSSLQRKVESNYGNDPINWGSGVPTPGRYFYSTPGLERPRITGQPRSHTARALFNTSFTVNARGGEASYQWLFNGTNLVDGTNATLQLIGVLTNQAGLYHVILSNASGSVTSAVATLTVTPSPPDHTPPRVTITSPPVNVRQPGTNVLLKGTASDNTAIRRVEYKIGRHGTFLPATGMTAWEAPITLNEGVNEIYARATDTSGNMTESGPYTINYDPDPFFSFRGAYNGLFYKTSGVEHASSGFFTLNLTEDGAFTATIQNAGQRYSTRGTFDKNFFNASNSIPRIGANPLTVLWTLAMDGSDQVTGTVSDGPNWTAELRGDHAMWNSRTNPAPFAAKYTLVLATNIALPNVGTTNLPPSPEGDGYGTATVDAGGLVNFRGFLADGTSVGQRVALSKDRKWPLYIPLYAGKGSLLGWVTFTSENNYDLNGLVSWIKPPLATSKYYPQGFTSETTLVGSRYIAPVGATNPVLNLTSGMITLTGGDLTQDLVNNLILGPGSQVTSNGPNKMTLTFTRPTGLFTGSITPNGSVHAISFKGAVLQSANNASGYFLRSNASGRVLLEPKP